MEIAKLSNSSYAFTFTEIADYDTSCFLLIKENRNYLIDTYCGSGFMHMIHDWIKNSGFQKELVVINTHYHWDHIWGNCLFKDSEIISHSICRKRMEEEWDIQIKKNKKYIHGDAFKRLPDRTFDNKITFEDDSIEIFYSPGHTNDSISVFDKNDNYLYVGDNLERPIIYVQDSNTDVYISTLKLYLEMNCDAVYSSHSLKHSRERILLKL